MTVITQVDKPTNPPIIKSECITSEVVPYCPPLLENMFDVEIAYATMKDEDYPF